MILYVETSALVKLYVEEERTPQVKSAWARASIVATSRLSYVEARAAFARASREARLLPDEHRQVVESLNRDWDHYVVVEATQSIVQWAGDLADRHALRAYDALHLASALTLRDRARRSLAFLGFDEPLNEAARREGLAL